MRINVSNFLVLHNIQFCIDSRPMMKYSIVTTAVLLAVLFNSMSFVTLGREKQVIKILGIFGFDEEEVKLMFQHAVEEANEELKRTDWILKGDIINFYESMDSFNLSTQLCNQLSEGNGYSAIFGPNYFELAHIVNSIAAMKKIPHIDVRWESESTNDTKIHINLFPNTKDLEKAVRAVLQDMDWDTFTLIYESGESLISLQEVLKEKLGRSEFDRPRVIMKPLPKWEEDYRPFLKEIKTSSETRIMLHCSPSNIIKILKLAKGVGLLQAYQNFFITYLDAHVIDYTQFRSYRSVIGEANITTLRLVNPDQFSQYIKNRTRGHNRIFNLQHGPETMKTVTALIRDAVLFFTQALKDMPKNFTTTPMNCFTSDEWDFGVLLTEKMKSIEYEGLSGRMAFSVSDGSRKFFTLGVIESLRSGGFRELGIWDPDHGIRYRRNQSQILEENTRSLENKTLRVASKLVQPYLSLSPNKSNEGNEVYEGFCKDLLDELAKLLKFNYTLYVPENNSDPGELQPETGRYTGLIGELTELRAEMAVCDFTITPERKQAVDFTAPFMSLGIGILYTVAPAKETSYFSFLDPFDVTVWIYLATAYLGLSITLYIIARCSPYEWEGAHPCDRDPDELENPWNLQTCLWLGIGVLLQQGCDVLPKGFSARLAVSMWCFFALIMTSTYTANLAAFLTTQRMESPIKSVEDLANQDEVKYGCLKKGATATFFRTSNDSLYQRMWATMESANPSVFAESNQKGVERVQRSRHKYAFFMESSSIDYEMNRDCDLTKIGNLLDSKFYGIAVPLGASYREVLTTGILQLKEDTVIERLKTKWWRHPENKPCEQVEDKDKDKLGLRNVGGVFLLLILGCTVSFFVSVLEFLWNVRKVAVREKILLSEAFWLEVKFAFKCSQTTKPVRHYPRDISLGTSAFSISQLGVNRADGNS